MVVHRFRLYHSTTGAQSLHDWLGQFTLNVNAALGNELSEDLPTLTETIDGETYYQGDLAFEWSEGKAQLFDNFDAYAASYCDWHRIGYHECTHDGTGGPCSWDEQRESGTVPSHIPDMSPSQS